MSFLEKFQSTKPSPSKANSQEMDILDKLQKEHAEVKKLCKKMADSESGAERGRLLKEIKKALIPHARAEEKIVYDRVAPLEGKKSKTESAEGYIEHHLADEMVMKLSKMKNKASAEFGAAAKVLKELLEHHIDEEESDIWPLVREHFSEDEREQMNREFEAAKKKVKIPA